MKKQAVILPRLEQPADIVVDKWGIAHIFAGSVRDAFFLQGYNAARDRLWQIDLWRKRGLGLLSASLGPAYVAQDRAARLLLYRGDIEREWVAYGPNSKAQAEAFVEGINAYVDRTRLGEAPVPTEFKLTASAPDTWCAEDIVRIRSHALAGNLVSEVIRAQVAYADNIDADRLRQSLTPPIDPILPVGLNLAEVPMRILRDYYLGTQEVSFSHPGQVLAELAGEPASAGDALNLTAEGSNGWVIGPSRTATGRPILASDPHRRLGAPSLRYVVQLNAPGLNVIGAGEPALPGISIGHNDKIAFGLTIFPIDQEDLYVYELDPSAPCRYRYQGGWENITVVREPLVVKGEKVPREVELLYTRHGPVLYVDAAHHRAFALRSVWSEAGTSAYFGSARYMTASNWDEFQAAMANWRAPSVNQLYADTDGHIAWIAAGQAPIRPNWDGLLPVPGDGRYEWAGFRDPSELPQMFDPPSDWWATANEMNLPPDYPAAERKISFEWADRSRIDRISEVLSTNRRSTLDDSMALQNDHTSPLALRLTALVKQMRVDDPGVGRALAMLNAWDGNEDMTSVAASIYEVWGMKHLGRILVSEVASSAAKLIGYASLDAAISYLETLDTTPGSTSKSLRDSILISSLEAALVELTERLGPDMDLWTWGRLHHLTWSPAVADLAEPNLRAQMSLGPLSTPGSGSTPNALGYRLDDFNITHGASFRMVLDVGDWDQSRVINAPGQSGDPASPHYRDHLPLWACGDYVPLLFSRSAIEEAAELVITLIPAARSGG